MAQSPLGSRRGRAVAALVLLLALPVSALGPPSYAVGSGGPDPTFDGDGLWEKTPIENAPGAAGMVVDSDGRIVMFGPSGGFPADRQSQLLRLTSTGAPDTTFSGDGLLPFEATSGAGTFESPQAMTVDADGRYVTLTGFFDGADYGFHVRRYTETGVLSLTATSTLASTKPNLPRDIATDATAARNIVVVGSDNTDSHMIATRLRGASGSPAPPDPAFGTGGTVSVNPEGPGHDSVAHAVEIYGSGRVLLGGISYDQPGEGSFSGRWVLVRLTASGDPDPSFSGDGIVLIDPPSGFGALLDLAIDARGRILAAGFSQPCGTIPMPDTCSPAQRPRLARFLANGSLDTSFGNGGWARLPSPLGGRVGSFQTVAVDSRGWILAGGSSGLEGSVVRFTPDGRPDTTFATGGVFLLDPYPTAGTDNPHAGTNRLAVGEGSVVAAGYARELAGYHWAAQRLDNNGTPAPTGSIAAPKPKPAVLKGTAGPSGLVARVQVAVQKVDARLLRSQHRCRWASGSQPRFVTAPAVRKAGRWTCVPPASTWRKASGKGSWRLPWDHALPAGRYNASLRVTLTSGRVKVVDTRGFSAR